MSYGYSNDLREKVLRYYDRGFSQIEVCEVFEISRATLNNWLVKRKSGDFSRRNMTVCKSAHKIDEHALREHIRQHPDAYLHEIAAYFKVSDVGVLKACRRLGISRKKNQPVSGA
jgi:transposase